MTIWPFLFFRNGIQRLRKNLVYNIIVFQVSHKFNLSAILPFFMRLSECLAVNFLAFTLLTHWLSTLAYFSSLTLNSRTSPRGPLVPLEWRPVHREVSQSRSTSTDRSTNTWCTSRKWSAANAWPRKWRSWRWSTLPILIWRYLILILMILMNLKFSEFAAFSYKPAHKFTLKLSYSKEIVFYKN